MAISINKNNGSAPSAQNITFTGEEMENFISSIREQILEEVREQLLYPVYNDIQSIRQTIKRQADNTDKSLQRLEKRMEQLCHPQIEERRNAAAARLAARNAMEEEED